MWQALVESELTYVHVRELSHKIARVRADLRDAPSDAELQAYLSKLLGLAHPPPQATPTGDKRLYACGSDVGLILVWATSTVLKRATEDRLPLPCHQIPDDGPCLIRVDVSIPIRRQQAPYWAWAAEQCELLFEASESMECLEV